LFNHALSTIGATALVTVSEQSNHGTYDNVDGHESKKLVSGKMGSTNKVDHEEQVEQSEYD
jgi:hypothetical protein